MYMTEVMDKIDMIMCKGRKEPIYISSHDLIDVFDLSKDTSNSGGKFRTAI